MCQLVDGAAKVQERTSTMLQDLVSSLSVSFDSPEVVTFVGRKHCTTAFSRIASLSGQGYLRDRDSTQQLIDLVSQFVIPNTASHSRRLLDSTVYPVTAAVREYS